MSDSDSQTPSSNDAKFAEKYASRSEEFQKTLQGVRDQLNQDREAFKEDIGNMKRQEMEHLENLRKEAAKFEEGK